MFGYGFLLCVLRTIDVVNHYRFHTVRREDCCASLTRSVSLKNVKGAVSTVLLGPSRVIPRTEDNIWEVQLI